MPEYTPAMSVTPTFTPARTNTIAAATRYSLGISTWSITRSASRLDTTAAKRAMTRKIAAAEAAVLEAASWSDREKKRATYRVTAPRRPSRRGVAPRMERERNQDLSGRSDRSSWRPRSGERANDSKRREGSARLVRTAGTGTHCDRRGVGRR